MLGNYGLDDEEALLDALTQARLAEERGADIGAAGELPAALAAGVRRAGVAPAEETLPVAQVAQARPRPTVPTASVSPAPVRRTDFTDEREADADAGLRRGVELAGRQALAGLTLQRQPTGADLVTQPGVAEATARADEDARMRDEAAQRQAELAERLAIMRQMERSARGDPEFEREKLEVRRGESRSLDEYRKGSLEARIAETERRRRADEERARRRDAPRPPKPPPERMLPASEVSALAELPVAEAQVDKLVDTFKRLNMGGMSGRASGAVTDIMGLRFTDAAEYNAAAKLAMQAAGKILEGGKLAAGDEVKYAAMLPRPGDSESVVKQKAEGLKAFLRDLATRRAAAFKDSGFSVAPSLIPGAQPGGSSQSPSAPPASGFVSMVGPDGDAVLVEPGDVEEFRNNGYRER